LRPVVDFKHALDSRPRLTNGPESVKYPHAAASLAMGLLPPPDLAPALGRHMAMVLGAEPLKPSDAVRGDHVDDGGVIQRDERRQRHTVGIELVVVKPRGLSRRRVTSSASASSEANLWRATT
jgi:hypothetical protein